MGLLMFVFIAILFLLMKALNLELVAELRFLNIFIVAYFSNRMANYYASQVGGINYLDGLVSIFLANSVAIIFTVLGLILYVKVFDPAFAENFKVWVLFAGDITLTKAALGIFFEGIAGSVIVSLIIMQYWQGEKRSIKDLKKHLKTTGRKELKKHKA